MVVGFGGWTSILSYGVGLLTSPSEFRPSFWGCDSCGAFCGVAREKGVDPGWMRNPENLLSINGFGSFCIVALYTNSLSWASCSFPKCSFRVTFKSGLFLTFISYVNFDVNVPFWIWIKKFRRRHHQMLFCCKCVVDIGSSLPLRHLVNKNHLAIFVEIFA